MPASPFAAPEGRLDRRPTRPGAGPGDAWLTRLARWAGRHPIGWVALGVVLLRIPGLRAAPGIDEAGYLMVARQWRAGGTSLYGDYWVDRPPLLMTLYRAAAELGGLVPLRLLGCLAAALTVLGVARAARSLGPSARRHSALWAALVAAAFCVSPVLGATEVNGELLAAPFVAWGIALTLEALAAPAGPGRRAQAVGIGAAAMAALLIKQNFADVAVFLVVAVGAAWLGGRLTLRSAGQLVAGALVGAVGVLLVAAGWTVWHGTSLVGLYDALYPFRVSAGRVLAGAADPALAARRWDLVGRVLESGVAVLLVLAGLAVAARRLTGAPTYAMLVVLAFDVGSILASGSYWSHYLIQLVVPVSLLTGALVSRAVPGARFVAVGMVAAACALYVAPADAASVSEGTALGSAIGAVARPGDTIVTVYGHSDVSEATGLSSPYPYLWSLPIKTLDPALHGLDTVLAGPRRPTWFVTWSGFSTWGVDSTRTAALVAGFYRPVAVLAGHTVYLVDGADRARPHLPAGSGTSG